MRTLIVIALLGITAWALNATAQDMQGPPPPPPDPMLMALDTNTNGVISADEIAAAPAALKTLDASGDGQLTRDELRPACPMGPQNANDAQRPPPPPMPIIKALDTNSDGVINADEIANAPTVLKTLDANGDGQLTQDEIRPPCPMGPPPCSTNTVSE